MAVNWAEPIVWSDGTPASITGADHWGRIGIYMDPDNMPAGVRFNGYPWRDNTGKAFMWVSTTTGVPNDPACYLPALPPYPHVINVAEREMQDAMDALVAW